MSLTFHFEENVKLLYTENPCEKKKKNNGRNSTKANRKEGREYELWFPHQRKQNEVHCARPPSNKIKVIYMYINSIKLHV